jgi:hypothetical protein
MTESTSDNKGADVIALLTLDHRDMLELLGQIDGTPDPSQRRDLADTAIAEVMRHSVAEEMFVYPAMEEHLPSGTEDVEHDKQEHDEIVQVMKQMEDVDASGPEFMGLVRQLEEKLQHHAHDEESEQFPKLRTHLSEDALVDMGHKVEAAKRLAPTRPHPSAPHSELFHKTVGPGIGMIDRLRDALTGRNNG